MHIVYVAAEWVFRSALGLKPNSLDDACASEDAKEVHNKILAEHLPEGYKVEQVHGAWGGEFFRTAAGRQIVYADELAATASTDSLVHGILHGARLLAQAAAKKSMRQAAKERVEDSVARAERLLNIKRPEQDKEITNNIGIPYASKVIDLLRHHGKDQRELIADIEKDVARYESIRF